MTLTNVKSYQNALGMIFFFCITILFFYSCTSVQQEPKCYTPKGLYKLSEKDLIKRAQLLIPKTPYIVFKNCEGHVTDSVEMNLLDIGIMTTDKYVNEKGVIVEEVVRIKTEEDEILDILIEEAYAFEDPFPFVNINCDSLDNILSAVYKSDQGKRTIDVPKFAINDPFEDETTVVNIIKQCGIPNKDDISENALAAIFLVLQHTTTDIMAAYYPYIRESAKSGNMKLRWLAMMEDRILLHHEKEQVYGTQSYKDPITNKSKLLPLRNPEQVNERRTQMGMDSLSQDFLTTLVQ